MGWSSASASAAQPETYRALSKRAAAASNDPIGLGGGAAVADGAIAPTPPSPMITAMTAPMPLRMASGYRSVVRNPSSAGTAGGGERYAARISTCSSENQPQPAQIAGS